MHFPERLDAIASRSPTCRDAVPVPTRYTNSSRSMSSIAAPLARVNFCVRSAISVITAMKLCPAVAMSCCVAMIAESRSASCRSASFARVSSAVRFCTLASSSSRDLLNATPRSHAPGENGRGSPSRLRIVNGAFAPLLISSSHSIGEQWWIEELTFHHSPHGLTSKLVKHR